MVRVRIRFAADVCFEGETMAEVKDKWETLPIFSEDAVMAGVTFLEIECVQDADNHEDLDTEFEHAYDEERR